uniref:Uncharacterized protein n=1 Tax=Arundo donax TaxID=35708 RepID=A0A0A9CVQ1_ARUDO
MDGHIQSSRCSYDAAMLFLSVILICLYAHHESIQLTFFCYPFVCAVLESRQFPCLQSIGCAIYFSYCIGIIFPAPDHYFGPVYGVIQKVVSICVNFVLWWVMKLIP